MAAPRICWRSRPRVYEAALFIDYTAAIITAMGGEGRSVDACAREIYDEWAGVHHFSLYDDVPESAAGAGRRGFGSA